MELNKFELLCDVCTLKPLILAVRTTGMKLLFVPVIFGVFAC